MITNSLALIGGYIIGVIIRPSAQGKRGYLTIRTGKARNRAKDKEVDFVNSVVVEIPPSKMNEETVRRLTLVKEHLDNRKTLIPYAEVSLECRVSTVVSKFIGDSSSATPSLVASRISFLGDEEPVDILRDSKAYANKLIVIGEIVTLKQIKNKVYEQGQLVPDKFKQTALMWVRVGPIRKSDNALARQRVNVVNIRVPTYAYERFEPYAEHVAKGLSLLKSLKAQESESSIQLPAPAVMALGKVQGITRASNPDHVELELVVDQFSLSETLVDDYNYELVSELDEQTPTPAHSESDVQASDEEQKG